ncbi:hypothetical protein C1H46_032915 [Malus baccata]|uniref:Uncharacterized protein n=1 Tax=Malus baccata TaxID=106549 RepID=A0A540L4W3_MALBA|nr:hypothetical protein C1H46_032915 [Malus baccata]
MQFLYYQDNGSGHDGINNEWGDYSRYVNPGGVEMTSLMTLSEDYRVAYPGEKTKE